MTRSQALEKLTEILAGLQGYPPGSPEEKLHFELASAVESSRLDDAFAASMRTINAALEKLAELGAKP